MRIVPLLPSTSDAQPWVPFPAVELAWAGGLHPGWAGSRPTFSQVHALHLAPLPWGPVLGETALAALRAVPGVDFLILGAPEPRDRSQTSAFLAVLEGLLEVAQGQGFKLALRPAPGAAPALVRHLREVRGAAVGFCWDSQVAGDLDCISDRLFCAVGAPGDDFRPIQRLGYRWNLAVPVVDPGAFLEGRERIASAFPPVLFPDLPEGGGDAAGEGRP